MKITIYELLGLVKDGKAPETIIYRDKTWEYTTTVKGTGYQYYSPGYQEWKTLQSQVYLEECLNDEVEIIEEPKKIEKISWREKESLAGELTASEKQNILARRTEKLKSSLNELIDEINNLKENK